MKRIAQICGLLSVVGLSSAAHAQTVTAPQLPGGGIKQIVVTYRATVNSDTPTSTTNVQSVATVSGSNFMMPPPATASTPVVIVPTALQGPVHFLWNGFLSMQNVVAVMNRSATPLNVNARMLNADGVDLSSTFFQVPAAGEYDLLVNLLPGFSTQSFGVLRLEFGANTYDGNGMYYRFESDQQQLEFEIGSAFSNAVSGTSFVPFNTIQPSRKASQLANAVLNWLSITNVDTAASNTFSVELYNQLGQLLRTTPVTIPPLGRRDIAAGHDFPGAGQVGLLRVVPANASAPYSAQLARYGASAVNPALAKFYHFAVVSHARNPSSQTDYVPISRGGNGENWLAVANTGASSAGYRVTFRSNSGVQLGTVDLLLNAYSQYHLFANNVLAPSETGIAEITSLDGSGFIADSSYYFYDSSTDETTAAYSSEARKPTTTMLTSSYNFFLEQFNFVKLFNIGTSSANAFIKVLNEDGTVRGTAGGVLGARSGFDIGIQDLPFAPPSDSFGQLSVLSDGTTLIGEVLRYQLSPDGRRIDAVQAIPVR